MKILHTGDWHIGSFNGPDKDGVNGRFLDICDRLEELTERARQERPELVIVAGDIFHAAKVWSDRGLRENQVAIKTIKALADVAEHVVVMRGTPNHDSAEQFKALKARFEGDERVRIVTEPEIIELRGKEKCQVCCIPGFERGYYRAKHPGIAKDEENEAFTKALENMIIGMRAACEEEIKILVSHFTIAGCNMESGQTASFLNQFEPVVYPATLQAAGYTVGCFGHIHRPQKLEGCENVFYCGALNQLTFNDEGQERGFYWHEVEGGEVKSRFESLGGRQMQTIRMDDEAVTAFINTPTELPPETDVEGKIVRVLYDCTDEHNKAFNHAILENLLYEAGAYFVQEVTPQKISVTVDREGLEAEDSPEENLREYLKGKDLNDEKIKEILEIAGPIIATCMAREAKEHIAGAFVPVEIEVRNYRNYEAETFNFEDVRFCTINGSNGVGKSSLFMDAMADALYEEPREGELTGWIRNAPEARSGAIIFTFRIGERTFRVTRTRQKSGRPTLNLSELIEGEWEDRSKEKIVDTQEEIINTIGMDSMTFKACALIMQDQYGIFLQADKETRMNILGDILGLGVYGEMQELASDKLTDTNREIRTLHDKEEALTQGIPDILEINRNIEEATGRIIALKERQKQKKIDTEHLRTALNTQMETAERVMKLNSRVANIQANRAAKEAAKTQQVAVITLADAVLSQEESIKNGVAEYEGLAEQEKELIEKKAKYDALNSKKTDLEMRSNKKTREVMDTTDKLWKEQEKRQKLEAMLTKEEELTEAHRLYEEKSEKLKEMDDLRGQWEELDRKEQAKRQEINDLKHNYEKGSATKKAEIENLEKKTELLKDSGCPDIENAKCRFLKDALEAKERLPQAEEQLRMLTETFENDERAMEKELGGIRMQIEALGYNSGEHRKLKEDIETLQSLEKEYQELGAKRAERDAVVERISEIKADIEKAEAEQKEIDKEKCQAEEEMETYKNAVGDLAILKAKMERGKIWIEKEKELPLQREKKKAAEERISELMGEIAELIEQLNEAEAELLKEKAGLTDTSNLQRMVEDADREINTIEDNIRYEERAVGAWERDIEDSREKRKEIETMQKAVNELGVRAADLEILKVAFSQDGIPHNIIRTIIPTLEATATNILGQMSGGKMSVEFDLEKTLKSDKKKEKVTLDVVVNDSVTGRLPYMSRSGGEKVKAALSVILALSEIKSGKAGIQLGFLFIDEPAFLDGTGTQAYVDALEAVQARYQDKKIMAISHDETFKARFPQSLIVYKDESGSHVARA